MTSALLFVALLALVDLSYRRWIRRSISRQIPRPSAVVDLVETADQDAAVIELPPRAQSPRPARRSG